MATWQHRPQDEGLLYSRGKGSIPTFISEGKMSIVQDRYRSAVLAALAPHLSGGLLAEALQDARAIEDREQRALALAALAPRLAAPEREAILAEALRDTRAVADEATRAQLLATLAPHLSEPLQAEALTDIRAMGEEEPRLRVLAALAPYFSPRLLADALREARASGNGKQPARTASSELPEEFRIVNGRRIRLIDKKYTAGLSPDEETELAQLHEKVDRLLAEHFPQPTRMLDELEKLVAELEAEEAAP
jgi:hypothetical protein